MKNDLLDIVELNVLSVISALYEKILNKALLILLNI